MPPVTTTDTMPKVFLAARPFGYLFVTLVYLALFAVMVVLGWGGLFLGLDHGFGTADDAPGLLVCLLVVVVVSPILGPALVLISTLTLSLTMLGGLALVRSLMPRYADTPLTHTVWSDSAVGPPRLTKGALSLLPTRPGRFADVALALNLGAQGSTWRTYAACIWLGAADMVTAGWIRWPATGAWAWFWGVVSLALVVLGVSGIVRSLRARPTGRTLGRRLP